MNLILYWTEKYRRFFFSFFFPAKKRYIRVLFSKMEGDEQKTKQRLGNAKRGVDVKKKLVLPIGLRHVDTTRIRLVLSKHQRFGRSWSRTFKMELSYKLISLLRLGSVFSARLKFPFVSLVRGKGIFSNNNVSNVHLYPT